MMRILCSLLVSLLVISPVSCSNYNILQDRLSGNESVNFLVIGDWGGLPIWPYYTPIEIAIAKKLAEFVKSKNIEFVLALGDNFYFDGVKSLEDSRFQDTYNAVFSEPELALDWYLLAGNHDHSGNVSAQIEYSKLVHRWKFPNYYYSIKTEIPSSNTLIEIIMIDTVQLCGNSDDVPDYQSPPGPANNSVAEEQWVWLEKQLSISKAEYLLVAGHYPVWSVGSHGPTKCLTKRLEPLLHKYSVTAYMCGHDHNLQHLELTTDGSTVQYFLSGAANFIDPLTPHKHSVPSNSSKFFWGDSILLGGFGHAEINKKEMIFSFYDTSGRFLYSKSTPPRKFL